MAKIIGTDPSDHTGWDLLASDSDGLIGPFAARDRTKLIAHKRFTPKRQARALHY
jgi:hypothetical protein